MSAIKKSSFDQILLGILFLLLSLACFLRPGASLGFLVIWLGIMAIIRGIISVLTYFKVKETLGTPSIWFVLVGLLSILFGLLFVTHVVTAAAMIGVLISLWVITDSVAHLTNARIFKGLYPGSWVMTIVLNLLYLLAGFFLLINPYFTALSVPFLLGMVFFFIGIQFFIYGFLKREDA